jgi:tetraacyldisaccharide 4'-kinase
MNRLEDCWYKRCPWLLLLTPVSLAYCGLVRARRWFYRVRWLAPYRLPVPVVVVGNLTVGGTGKTPLVIWLVDFLKAAGYRPGVIARGYGGRARDWPQRVHADSDPLVVGDEVVLLAGRCGCPVVAGPDRVKAARTLVETSDCDLIVSDDGLQHYALARDVEIVVIDGERRFGNGFCLPAGPLREPLTRLASVDLTVVNGRPAAPGEHSITPRLEKAVSLERGRGSRSLADLGHGSVHAVAGIGNPGRFFAGLRQAGIRFERHVFPDHHVYVASELAFGDGRPLVMTEKDAVKCRKFVLANSWYIPVTIEMSAEFGDRVLDLLTMRTNEAASG